MACGRRAERGLGFLLRRGVLALLAGGAGGVARPPTRLLQLLETRLVRVRVRVRARARVRARVRVRVRVRAS